jgi:hypothetical protein
MHFLWLNTMLETNMRRPLRILLGLAVTGILIAYTYALLKPNWDEDPRTNLSYIAWKAGFHRYSPAYANLIMRDPDFRQGLIGQRLEDVVTHYGMTVHDGASFAATSYRGQYQKMLKTEEPEVRCYWLDGQAEEFGYCIWVVNQRIKDVLVVKG